MTTQITVRLTDAHVKFIDAQVRAGRAKSRAAYIDHSIGREMRRRRAIEDLEKIQATPDPDAEAIVNYLADHPLDLSHLD